MERDEEARAAARAILNAVNRAGFDEKAFVDEIVNNGHRTLQQGVMRAFCALMWQWSLEYTQSRFDMRNQHTVVAAYDIVKHFGDRLHFPYV